MEPIKGDPLARAFRGMRIAASALDAERSRIDIIAKNVANARTTRMPDTGLPYRREVASFRPVMSEVSGGRRQFVGLRVDEVIEDQSPFEEVFDPRHPDANERGIVLYPNVNTMKEMADLVTAVRSYEANLSVVETTERMADRALRLAE
jgi:flagellar basal-body rod protein FlgC